jgi:protein ImuB
VRTACCRVPDLPLAAELRANPEFADKPLAVASGAGPRAELVTVSPEAARRGVVRLATVAHARTVCAELLVRVASPARERAAREALLDAALSFSPRVALAPRASGSWAAEAAVFVDASGVSSLFHSEQGFAAALAQRCQRLGLPVCVAVASSRSVARIAARRLSASELRVLAPGAEATFLAPLPLDILDPDDALAEALTRFGVRRVRDLLALPRRALGTRLGPQVLELIALARGATREPLLPVPVPRRLVEAADLEFAIDRLEPLAFALQGLLSRLLIRLETRRLACDELALHLDLEGGGRDARRIGLAAPTLDRRVLMRLLVHALEAHPPEAPVVSAGLETEGRPVRGDQLDLFRPAGPAPAALGHTLVELQALCGRDRIGTPRPSDDHRPHLFEMAPFSRASLVCDSPRNDTPGQSASVDCPHEEGERCSVGLATRALRPPLPAEVRLQGGGPGWIRSAVANGRVVHLAGPWRTTGGWWSPEIRFAYDYFDVETSDGTIARLRFDHVQKRWHVDAVYD